MSNTHVQASAAVPKQRKITSLERTTRVALVGGFKPTKCGIATFTTDVYEQLCKWLPGYQIDVYAMQPARDAPIAPDVAGIIQQNDVESYKAAALRMNESGVDVIWIQHEFGIYGGEAGDLILELINAVAAPIVITLHTVLQHPTDQQRAVIARMKAKASRFVVMSAVGRDILQSTYGVDPRQVQIVEHGAPDRPFAPAEEARASAALRERPTIMTFGLLGPGKGLETAIRAMPAILQRHPDTIYRIVGATHPNLVKVEGEAYRDGLKALASDLGVAQSIEWVEKFLECDDLLDQLASCDIYLTPYPNLAQSTSGTLAYAVALGCAVVSTPYVHAREILADGVGSIVSPNDPDQIAASVNDLLANPSKLATMRSRSYARGRQTIWSEFAARYGAILTAAMPKYKVVLSTNKQAERPSTGAFLALVDDVGMLQHSVGIVPDRHHGYCIDDNARALILANLLGEDYQHLALRFAAFLQHGWNPDTRRFRNFMAYDRRWLEPVGSDDSNGRALWAIGHAAHEATDVGLREWAIGLFNKTAPELSEMRSPRTMAFLVLAADRILARDRSNRPARHLISRCADGFAALTLRGEQHHEGWQWFENVLSYDNCRIPQALFVLSSWTGDRRFAAVALEQLGWLCTMHTTPKGHFRPIGSEGFSLSRETRPFDQQPVEAWAMIDACAAAMVDYPSDAWSAMASKAYAWYFMCNDRGLAIGNAATGACYDGLMAQGVNVNTGAESVLSFSLAYQSLIRFPSGDGPHVETDAYTRDKLSTH